MDWFSGLATIVVVSFAGWSMWDMRRVGPARRRERELTHQMVFTVLVAVLLTISHGWLWARVPDDAPEVSTYLAASWVATVLATAWYLRRLHKRRQRERERLATERTDSTDLTA